MKHWNYRIVRMPCDHANIPVKEDMEPHYKYEIHEVYYDSDGVPVMRTESPQLPAFTAYECDMESPDEIVPWLERVVNDLKRHPVLKDEDIHSDTDLEDD